jgi:hypothetical protein
MYKGFTQLLPLNFLVSSTLSVAVHGLNFAVISQVKECNYPMMYIAEFDVRIKG